MVQKNVFWVFTSDERSDVISDDLQEIKMKNWCNFWTPHPKKPVLIYIIHDEEKKIMSFDLWWEVRGNFRRPLRGQIDMKDFFCHSHNAKNIFLTSDLWWEVRGRLRRPLRGQNKKLMLFLKSPAPKKHYFDMHDAKNIFEFWYLVRGQGSFFTTSERSKS